MMKDWGRLQKCQVLRPPESGHQIEDVLPFDLCRSCLRLWWVGGSARLDLGKPAFFQKQGWGKEGGLEELHTYKYLVGNTPINRCWKTEIEFMTT